VGLYIPDRVEMTALRVAHASQSTLSSAPAPPAPYMMRNRSRINR
jgi:hypothetical protein